MGDLWGNVLEGTREEDEGKQAQTTEGNLEAIRINTSPCMECLEGMMGLWQKG